MIKRNRNNNFAAVVALMLFLCLPIAADEYDKTIISGLWHIKGGDETIYMRLELTGTVLKARKRQAAATILEYLL